MLTFLLRRLLAMIPTLFGITFVTFAIINCAPGDPVSISLGAGEGGGGGTAAGGGISQDKLADAKKAKRLLLGFVEPDRAVRVWDLDPAREAPKRDPENPADTRPAPLPLLETLGELRAWPRGLALHAPDRILYACSDAGRIEGIDTETGEVVRDLRAGELDLWTVDVSSDGATLVASNIDGELFVIGARDGAQKAFLTLPRLSRSLAFLPDGRTFLSACDDGIVREHDASTAEVLRELPGHNAYVACLAVDADGSRFWSGGYDRKLREWSLETGDVVRVLAEHGQAITDIAVSRDGERLASACEDRVVRVFPLASGDVAPQEIRGHGKAVTAVAFTPDGEWLCSGGRDGLVFAWPLDPTRRSAQVREDTGSVSDLVVSPDGTRLYSASESYRTTSIAKRYVTWLGKTATADFGRSFVDEKPVMDKILDALPVTLGLNLLSILIIYIVAIPMGVAQAVRRGKTFDVVTSVILFLLWSMPSFWVATLLITNFSSERHLNLFPSVGMHAVNQDDLPYLEWLKDWGAHLVLPLIVFTYSGFAGLSQYMRTSMLETIAQDYVRTARAKGLSERVVIFKHALRNSLITIVTLVATLLPAMIAGSIIVEMIFSIRGMGLLAFDALLKRDYPVIMAVTTFSALLTLVGILVSDLLYGVVDPRIAHS